MLTSRRFLYGGMLAVIGVGLIFLGPLSAVAQEDVGELKQKITELEARIQQLEQGQPQTEDPFFNDDILGNDPFLDMRRMRERMENMFRNFHTRYPQIQQPSAGSGFGMANEFSLQESDQGYEIRLDLSGLDQDKVDVEIKKNSITVTGQYSAQEKQQDPNRYFESHTVGSFLKTIPLPIDADTSKVETQQKGDILVINIAKKK